jgi:hypothetical protein
MPLFTIKHLTHLVSQVIKLEWLLNEIHTLVKHAVACDNVVCISRHEQTFEMRISGSAPGPPEKFKLLYGFICQ